MTFPTSLKCILSNSMIGMGWDGMISKIDLKNQNQYQILVFVIIDLNLWITILNSYSFDTVYIQP